MQSYSSRLFVVVGLVGGFALAVCMVAMAGAKLAQQAGFAVVGQQLLARISFVSSAHAQDRRKYDRWRRQMQRMRWQRRQALRRQRKSRQQQQSRRRATSASSKAPSKAPSRAKANPAKKNAAPSNRNASQQKAAAQKKTGKDKTEQNKTDQEKSANSQTSDQAQAQTQQTGAKRKGKKKKAETVSDVLSNPSATVVGFAQRLFSAANTKQVSQRKKRRLRRKLRRQRQKAVGRAPSRTKQSKAVKTAATPVAGNANSGLSAAPVVATSAPPKQTKRRRRRRAVPRLPWSSNGPKLSRSIARGELLVANITPSLVKQASELGISVSDAQVKLGADTTLTRITFSKSRSTATVVGLVSKFISGDRVFANHRYFHYDPAAGQARGGWQTSIPSNSNPACATTECYGAHVIGWNEQLARCAQGRRIGVIDSAIDTRHRTFNQQQIRTKRLHERTRPSTGAAGHGTGVLAILAGNRASGTPGLVPDARFYHVDAFFRSKDGALTSDTLSLVKALGVLRRWRAEIVNLSLVGPKDELVEKALQELSDQGAVIVSAAGNAGPAGGTSYPAGYQNVIAVTAIDKRRRAYAYANRGAFIDLAAPGVDIWTALPNQRQGLQSGTSFAVPFATALVAAIYKGLPNTDRLSVLERIPTTDLGRKGKDSIYGVGLIQAPETCRNLPIVASLRTEQFASLGANNRIASKADRNRGGWRASVFSQTE